MRIYVIGAGGQVARSLREAAAKNSDLIVGFGARPSIDLLDPKSIHTAISNFRPDVVVNPAAYTAVDKAESEVDAAYAINCDGARAVARAAQQLNASIIHFSTDYVFDGRKVGPYLETDPTGPQGVYGKSKREGELAVAAENPRHVILRTSWVYAPFGHNFVRTILRLGRERDRLRVVNDQKGCPTYAPDIADAVYAIARQLKSWQNDYAGITHLAGPDAMTRYQFACEVSRNSAARGGPSPAVDPIPTAEYLTPAARPVNSELATKRLRSLFGLALPPMKLSLANCLDRISLEWVTK